MQENWNICWRLFLQIHLWVYKNYATVALVTWQKRLICVMKCIFKFYKQHCKPWDADVSAPEASPGDDLELAFEAAAVRDLIFSCCFWMIDWYCWSFCCSLSTSLNVYQDKNCNQHKTMVGHYKHNRKPMSVYSSHLVREISTVRPWNFVISKMKSGNTKMYIVHVR